MLGENRKWSDISDFDLVLNIETLDKVPWTWENVFSFLELGEKLGEKLEC